ncbi:peptidyl-prolyl cis-trans isomerase [Marssonina coronariae]|uniref:peptidylprolyl isomerase n=1 Tax=Diplocarpon coronariae TaxID=2795749 RepID=A0A218Z4I4_9HELO|nr:peptidyl-prolyl cis-trans isomerase [Diplocarpon mali]OWP02175.1 peptidyl-prolyl cis-trans isomerase [Marssonina coronariae]
MRTATPRLFRLAGSSSSLFTLNTSSAQPTTISTIRSLSRTSANMGVTKTVLKEGSGAIPKAGDYVTIEYTGYLKDTTKPGNKGTQFDSSVGRGAFVTEIGTNRVIKGNGFSKIIPANADLIFDVELQKIN